jgi:hypothetical protein
MSELNDLNGEENETSPLDDEFKVGEYEIQVVDEREPEDQRDPAAGADSADEGEPTDEELQAVSARVKKRIDKLTFKINDERRGREAAERMQEEAIRFARAQQDENGQLRTLMAEGESVLVTEVRSRTEAEVKRAQQEYALAAEEGDPVRLSAAQMQLNRAQIEQHEAESYQPQIAVQPGQTPTGTVPQAPPAPQAPQAPVVDQDFENWKGRNDWFDKDLPKRQYAMAVHEEMANNQNTSGVIVGSAAYYTEIDKRMSAVFPAASGSEGTSEPAATPAPPVVAPSSRQSADSGSPRKVQLTETQVSLAKRLGIPLEIYARETLKLGDS